MTGFVWRGNTWDVLAAVVFVFMQAAADERASCKWRAVGRVLNRTDRQRERERE